MIPVLMVIFLTIIAIVIFLLVRNRKDEKDFEQYMNEQYPKRRKHRDENNI